MFKTGIFILLSIYFSWSAWAQTEAYTSSCGRNALALMKFHLGEHQNIDSFSRPLDSENNSLTFTEIRAIAASAGLQLEGVKLFKGDLAGSIYPAIVPWGVNHFAVLLKVADGFAFVANPPSPIIRLPVDDFLERSDGYALIPKNGGMSGVNIGLCVENTEVELSEENRTGVIKFYNFGDGLARVKVAAASCSCIEALDSELDLLPGEEKALRVRVADGSTIKNAKDMIALNGDFPPFGLAVINAFSISPSGIYISPSRLDFLLQKSGTRAEVVIKIEHPIGAEISTSDLGSLAHNVGGIKLVRIREQLTLARFDLEWKNKGFIEANIPFKVVFEGRTQIVTSKLTALVY